ncbi:MAG: hypothetical protein VYC67_00295, partial [Pseudomonadota bacterium]|nr:hypothetical protein [Pseudomonadota bacterium]
MKTRLRIVVNRKFRQQFFIFVSLIGLTLSANSFGQIKDESYDSIVILGGWLIDGINQDRQKNKGI